MSTAEAVLLIAELLDVAFGHFISDCGGDFIVEIAPTVCKDCKFYSQCERMTKVQSINAKLQEALVVKEPEPNYDSHESAGLQEETMDHLAEAKTNAHEADIHPASDWMRAHAQLAIAHALIALVERMDEAAKDAELEMERRERYQEYQARREMGIAL